MDGTSRTVLHNTSQLGWPIALTIDYKDQRLYWTGEHLDAIESLNVDGTGYVLFTAEPFVYSLFDITFYQGRLYWTNSFHHAVFAVHSTLPDNVTEVVSVPYWPWGIHVIASSRQPEGTKLLYWCSIAHGTHACIFGPAYFTELHGTERKYAVPSMGSSPDVRFFPRGGRE